jgi:DNA-nicking Smr family endonuclease
MNNKEDKSLFEAAMEDVEPLRTSSRYAATPPGNNLTFKRQFKPSTDSSTPTSSWVIPDHLDLLTPLDHLFYLKNSLPSKLIRQLKRGQLHREAELDLHGYHAIEAAEAAKHFIEEAITQHKRLIHIIHGKGSLTSGSKLKTYLDFWLRDVSDVLAFCSATPKDGGTGCLYVLLKRRNSTIGE